VLLLAHRQHGKWRAWQSAGSETISWAARKQVQVSAPSSPAAAPWLRQVGNFLSVIAKAKEACQQAAHDCDDHFAGVGKLVTVGSGAKREIDDIVLSRYAIQDAKKLK